MLHLREGAGALPAGQALVWARAGAENADELSDWTIKLGTAALYKVHTAVVASGARHSVPIRAQAIAAAKGEGGRTTDVLQLIKNEAARLAISKDPHAVPTLEVLLNWMYGVTSDFSLPSLGGTPVVRSAARPPPPAAAAMGGAAAAGNESVFDMFSTAIFGTPTKSVAASPKPSPAGGAAPARKPAAAGGANGAGGLAVKPEQLPLLWLLADALGVRGLKVSPATPSKAAG